MADIISIHGGANPLEPNAEIVECLEELLEQARSGELRGFGYAVVTSDDVLFSGWSSEPQVGHTLGTAISMLQHRYIGTLVDTQDEPE